MSTDVELNKIVSQMRYSCGYADARGSDVTGSPALLTQLLDAFDLVRQELHDEQERLSDAARELERLRQKVRDVDEAMVDYAAAHDDRLNRIAFRVRQIVRSEDPS